MMKVLLNVALSTLRSSTIILFRLQLTSVRNLIAFEKDHVKFSTPSTCRRKADLGEKFCICTP